MINAIYVLRGKIMLSVRLPEEVEKRLGVLAKKTGRTKTFYVREAVLDHLEDLEDIYLSLERLKKNERRFSLKEVEDELNLDN